MGRREDGTGHRFGLIGSECARVLCQQGWYVVGIDNDMRSWFLWRGWQHRGVTGPQPSAVELHGSQLHRDVRRDEARAHHLRLQREASPRSDQFTRRGAPFSRILRGAAVRRSLQPRRREGKQPVHSGDN